MTRPFFAILLTVLLSAVPSDSFAQGSTYRLEIPRGTLKAAVSSFEAATGTNVTIVDGMDLEDFDSPGIRGVMDARDALTALVAGTGLSVDGDAPAFTLRIAGGPVRVEVTGRISPYRPVDGVTAMKTVTPLRDIPQTISVVPIELLRDQRAQSVADAVRNVPGVSVAQGEGNRDQIVIRGINTTSDFFVNGVRDDQERFRDLYNVEAMEVVQGPAAVLFGRGGAGGIVNLVTIRPTRDAASDAALETGAYGHRRGTLQFGVPVGGSGAFRMAAMAENSGGFRDGYFLHRYGVNPTLGLQFGARASLTVGVEHLSDHRLADRGIPSQAGLPVRVPRSQMFGSISQNDARSTVNSGRATLEYRFSDSLTLRNNLLVGRYHKTYQNVYPGTAVNAAGTFSLAAYDHAVDRVNMFNQTDLLYNRRWFGLQHVLLGGVEAGHQFQDELRHTAASIANVPVASANRDANFAAAALTVDRHATAGVLGVYAQDQIALSRHWKAVLGTRVDRFAVRVNDHLPGSADLSRTDTNVSPRAGVIFQPSDAVSLYGSYSYTFLPSGQTIGLAKNTAQVAPENARNYEVGAKLELLGGQLSVATAVFRLDRNNVKNTDPDDPARLVLTGQQRAEGVVTSVAGNLTRRWKFSGGYANVVARVTQDTVAAPAGRRVGLVPRHQVTAWSTYDLTKEWSAGGGIVGQSGVFASFTNQVRLPAFTRVDAVTYYQFGRFRLGLHLDNALNANYYPTAHSDNNISPGTPRNVHATLRASF